MLCYLNNLVANHTLASASCLVLIRVAVIAALDLVMLMRMTLTEIKAATQTSLLMTIKILKRWSSVTLIRRTMSLLLLRLHVKVWTAHTCALKILKKSMTMVSTQYRV